MELGIQGGQDRTEFAEQRITEERATKKKKSLTSSAVCGLVHTIRMRKNSGQEKNHPKEFEETIADNLNRADNSLDFYQS